MEKNQAAGSPPTPCVRNCCLDEQEICLGCHRTLAEILAWANASEAEKQAILARCERRCENRRASWPQRPAF